MQFRLHQMLIGLYVPGEGSWRVAGRGAGCFWHAGKLVSSASGRLEGSAPRGGGAELDRRAGGLAPADAASSDDAGRACRARADAEQGVTPLREVAAAVQARTNSSTLSGADGRWAHRHGRHRAPSASV